MILTIEQVTDMLQVMIKNNANAIVDWHSQKIQVLSKPVQDIDRIMSDGKPMEYRNILYQMRD